jgi:hypothetical protein
VAIEGYLQYERVVCVRNLSPFPLATALFIGDVSTTFTYLIRFAYSRCENSHMQKGPTVLAERTRLRQYIGATIVYFLNRQGGSNLQIFWGIHFSLLIQKVN